MEFFESVNVTSLGNEYEKVLLFVSHFDFFRIVCLPQFRFECDPISVSSVPVFLECVDEFANRFADVHDNEFKLIISREVVSIGEGNKCLQERVDLVIVSLEFLGSLAGTGSREVEFSTRSGRKGLCGRKSRHSGDIWINYRDRVVIASRSFTGARWIVKPDRDVR